MLSIKNSSISAKKFFQKTINIGQNSIFTQKRDEKHPGTARNVAQTCIFWKFRHFYIKIAIWFALHCSAKKLTALWKFSIFSKKIFFSIFSQNQYSRFFQQLSGPCEVKSGQLRPLKVTSSHVDDVISKLLRH